MMRASFTSDEVDITDLIEFANAYRDLGLMVQEQVETLLNGDEDDFEDRINPNAVDLIKEKIGGCHEDLDTAIDAYEIWLADQ